MCRRQRQATPGLSGQLACTPWWALGQWQTDPTKRRFYHPSLSFGFYMHVHISDAYLHIHVPSHHAFMHTYTRKTPHQASWWLMPLSNTELMLPFLFFFYVYLCFAYMDVCQPRVCSAHRSHKRVSDPLERKSQTAMSCHVGAGNWTQSSRSTEGFLITEPFL